MRLALGKEREFLIPNHGESIDIISALSHFISRRRATEYQIGARLARGGQGGWADGPGPEGGEDWA